MVVEKRGWKISNLMLFNKPKEFQKVIQFNFLKII